MSNRLNNQSFIFKINYNWIHSKQIFDHKSKCKKHHQFSIWIIESILKCQYKNLNLTNIELMEKFWNINIY